MKDIFLGVETKFSAAHKLPNYQGKHKNLHGHTWKVRVVVKYTNSIDSLKNSLSGMITDFGELKERIHSYTELYLDHRYLNELIPNPTAELLAIHLWKHLEMKINSRTIVLHKIKLWESENSFVILGG